MNARITAGPAAAIEQDTRSELAPAREGRAPIALPPIAGPEIVLAHLGPGALAMVFTLIASPLLWRAGYPPDLGLLIGGGVLAVLVRVGYLLRIGRRRGGRLSLRGALAPWWDRMPAWQFVGLYLALVAYGVGLYVAYAPIANTLATHLFGWLPAYLSPAWDATREGFARGPLLAWAIALLILDGVVTPVVEELYFRGNLLPRMQPALGWWAPVVSAALFGLQHFWQLYNAPFLFLFWLVAGPVVMRKRNLGLGIALHITSNTIGAVLVLAAILTR